MREIILALFAMLSAGSVAFANTEVFKLYPMPDAIVNQSCDIHTKLLLEVVGNIGTAKLSDHVGGFCEIFVPENKRSYQLVLKETNCGSKTYQQTEDAVEAIEVIDNRSRLCEDIVQALIVLKEYGPQGTERELYSKDL